MSASVLVVAIIDHADYLAEDLAVTLADGLVSWHGRQVLLVVTARLPRVQAVWWPTRKSPVTPLPTRPRPRWRDGCPACSTRTSGTDRLSAAALRLARSTGE